MKIPAKVQIKTDSAKLSASEKQLLLQETSPIYIGYPLPDPIELRGKVFPFVVAQFKMTPEAKLEQHGNDVVLCQTEAEMKESVQLLSEMAREVMVAFQCNNIGQVAFVQPGGRAIITEHAAGTMTCPDGRKVWMAMEREIDKATGAVIVKRKREAADEKEAEQIAQQWLAEYNREKQKHFDEVAKSKIPSVPADSLRCDTLTTTDMDDAGKARMAVMRRQWPHCFEIFDNRNAGRRYTIDECRKAYVLDWTEQGENPLAVREKIPADAGMDFWNALKKASDRAAKGKKKLGHARLDC